MKGCTWLSFSRTERRGYLAITDPWTTLTYELDMRAVQVQGTSTAMSARAVIQVLVVDDEMAASISLRDLNLLRAGGGGSGGL